MNKSLHPSYLFIGSDSTQNYDAVTHYLQQVICTKNGCLACSTCQQIATQQHPYVLWLKPENKYTLDDFDEVFKKIAFTLEQDVEFFFIIQDAHLLSAACSNALLKIVEEPPTGYHFIFTTHHLHAMLPTIRSRSLIKTVHTKHAMTAENIHAKNFIQKSDPQTFLLYISKTPLTEPEINDLINFLIQHYTKELIKQINTAPADEYNFLQAFLNFLHTATQKQIMPGSGKLFLKELYLHKDALERYYALT